MTTAPGLAALAALLADATRAAMCLALLDGRAWTAGELAAHAGVARPTATGHLDRLVAGGLLTELRQGRHRYVRLAGPDVARLLEDLTARVEPRPAAPKGLRASAATEALRRGRTCYDHLAGRLGVAVTDAMIRAGMLDRSGGFTLTGTGRAWLAGPLGADPRGLRARACLDWTERREHLAGPAGARLCTALLDRAWVTRIGTGRAVRLTPPGRAALRDHLELAEAL